MGWDIVESADPFTSQGCLPPGLFKLFDSSLMVIKVPSLALRLSGESIEASGVVPHDEFKPICDIDEAGDAVIDVEDPC